MFFLAAAVVVVVAGCELVFFATAQVDNLVIGFKLLRFPLYTLGGWIYNIYSTTDCS